MKNILLNSDTSHLDLDNQSDFLFSQLRLYLIKYLLQLEITAEHAQRALKMSWILSHSATAWNNYIPAFLTEI